MNADEIDALLGDELAQKLHGGAPAAAAPRADKLQGPPTIDPEPMNPGKVEFGPTGDMEKYQAWRSKQRWPVQMALPSDFPEMMGMAATGGMGAEVGTGMRGAARLGSRVARSWLPRIGLGAAAGAAGAKMEGTPMLGGALKGGSVGALSEGVYAGQRAIGMSRLGGYLRDEIPRRLSAVAQRHASWIPEFRTPGEFVHVIGQLRRGDTGAQNRISALWDREIGAIGTQLRRQAGGTQLVTRWNPGDPIVGGVTAPRNWEEALTAIDELGEAGFKEGLAKSGIPASRAIRAREQLIEDVGNHLERVGGPQLREQWEGARDQYGRAKGLINLLSQPGVVANGRLNREPLQEAWSEMSRKGLDLDAKWNPGELDELEHSLFGDAGPTATDVPGKAPRLRTALTTRHIPPLYADPPTFPVFQGEQPAGLGALIPGPIRRGLGMGEAGPLGPWTPPQVTHLATQAAVRAGTGKVRDPEPQEAPQDVVMPDTPGTVQPGMGLSPEILQQIKAHPDLQGLSEDEIRALYQQAVGR